MDSVKQQDNSMPSVESTLTEASTLIERPANMNSALVNKDRETCRDKNEKHEEWSNMDEEYEEKKIKCENDLLAFKVKYEEFEIRRKACSENCRKVGEIFEPYLNSSEFGKHKNHFEIMKSHRNATERLIEINKEHREIMAERAKLHQALDNLKETRRMPRENRKRTVPHYYITEDDDDKKEKKSKQDNSLPFVEPKPIEASTPIEHSTIMNSALVNKDRETSNMDKEYEEKKIEYETYLLSYDVKCEEYEKRKTACFEKYRKETDIVQTLLKNPEFGKHEEHLEIMKSQRNALGTLIEMSKEHRKNMAERAKLRQDLNKLKETRRMLRENRKRTVPYHFITEDDDDEKEKKSEQDEPLLADEKRDKDATEQIN